MATKRQRKRRREERLERERWRRYVKVWDASWDGMRDGTLAWRVIESPRPSPDLSSRHFEAGRWRIVVRD